MSRRVAAGLLAAGLTGSVLPLVGPTPAALLPAAYAGELVAVMGPSGSSKSTLLTLAGGLDTPTSGMVHVEGVDLAALGQKGRAAMRRTSIGYVFQDFNLIPALTAAENVALPLELDGHGARNARRSARAALEEVGIGDLGARFPDEMSGGQQQRTAIARALVGDRRLVLADEPTGALDTVNSEAVMRLLRGICSRGASGVVVTHEAQLASWADRVVFLRDGRIEDQGTHAELLARNPGYADLVNAYEQEAEDESGPGAADEAVTVP